MVVPMRITVRFVRVGRAKLSWTATLPNTAFALAREAKKSGHYRSSDVFVDLDMQTGRGQVLVGGWRHVGDVELLDPKPTVAT